MNAFYCSEMSDGDGVDKLGIHDDDEIDSNYKPPPVKSIEELLNADKEDASLQKYKEKLLGDANSGKIIFGNYYILYYDKQCLTFVMTYELLMHFLFIYDTILY